MYDEALNFERVQKHAHLYSISLEVSYRINARLDFQKLYYPRIAMRYPGFVLTAEMLGAEQEMIRHFFHAVGVMMRANAGTSFSGKFGLQLLLQFDDSSFFSFPYLARYGEVRQILDIFCGQDRGCLYNDADDGYQLAIFADDQFFYLYYAEADFEPHFMKFERRDIQAQASVIATRLISQLDLLIRHCGKNLWGFVKSHSGVEASREQRVLLLDER